jgi:hypothetical protein
MDTLETYQLIHSGLDQKDQGFGQDTQAAKQHTHTHCMSAGVKAPGGLGRYKWGTVLKNLAGLKIWPAKKRTSQE